MRATTDRIDLRLPAVAASLRELRAAAIGFAARHGCPNPHDVGLAVTEAATNVVHHAYLGEEAGDVRLVMCAEAERLVVVVRDWGHGMVPRPDSPGMGLGLPTIATLAAALKVEEADGAGTLLRMHFPYATPRAA